MVMGEKQTWESRHSLSLLGIEDSQNKSSSSSGSVALTHRNRSIYCHHRFLGMATSFRHLPAAVAAASGWGSHSDDL
jgi:hypothetical protein